MRTHLTGWRIVLGRYWLRRLILISKSLMNQANKVLWYWVKGRGERAIQKAMIDKPISTVDT